MPALVRSAALTHFADLSARCGLDGPALVREVGLPQRCLDEPDLKIPTRLVSRLFQLAAERGSEPSFGLRMAETRRLSNLGPLALMVRDEPTLRNALEALMRHIHVHNEALAVRVEQVGNLVVVRLELDAEGMHSVRQATELVVGVTVRVLQVLMGSGWRPRLVCFAHSAPTSLRLHHRVLGPAVEFGHEFDGIVCNAADLDVPNPGADPVMARYAQRLLGQVTGSQAMLTESVRHLVIMLLPRGLCRIEVVAQHLGMDRRTVARRLAAEQTSFSALVNALRRDLFSRYLDHSARPLSDVAALLGFSAPSALSRWHRQQFGCAARQIRARSSGPARGSATRNSPSVVIR